MREKSFRTKIIFFLRKSIRLQGASAILKKRQQFSAIMKTKNANRAFIYMETKSVVHFLLVRGMETKNFIHFSV